MIVINRTASTRAQKRPAAPTLSIPSNFDLPVYMSDIVIIGNAHFVRFGSLVVRLGNATLLDIKAGDAALAQRLTIQTRGRRWSQNDVLELFAWTSQGEATITVIAAQSPEPIEPGAVPLPMDAEQLNRLVATDAAAGRVNSAREFLNWAAGQDIQNPPDKWTEMLMCGFDLNGIESYATDFEARGGIYAEAAKRLRALDETIPIPSYDGDALFPNKFYFNESHTRLIDMEGNKNVIVTLSAPQTPAIGLIGGGPHIASSGSFPVWTNPLPDLPYNRENALRIYDAWQRYRPHDAQSRTVSGQWNYDLVLPSNRTARVVLPLRMSSAVQYSQGANSFGFWARATNSRTRQPYFATYFWRAPTVAYDYGVSSADNPQFRNPTAHVARERVTNTVGQDVTVDDVPNRFLRLTIWATITWAPPTGPHGTSPGYNVNPFQPINWSISPWRSPLTALAVRDENITGGSGSIKFEVPNALGAWQDYTEPVAIARGDNISRQYGQANSSVILPSGPRALRARLDVTGALETSAAITLVS